MKIYELNELFNPEDPEHNQDMIRDLTTDGMLQAGPPYPKEDMPKVKMLQQALQDLGYDVGSTGVDGKYGPRTTRAVRAFKADYNLPGSGLEFGTTSVAKIQSIKKGTTPKKRPQPVDKSAAGGGEIGPMPTFGGPTNLPINPPRLDANLNPKILNITNKNIIIKNSTKYLIFFIVFYLKNLLIFLHLKFLIKSLNILYFQNLIYLIDYSLFQ